MACERCHSTFHQIIAVPYFVVLALVSFTPVKLAPDLQNVCDHITTQLSHFCPAHVLCPHSTCCPNFWISDVNPTPGIFLAATLGSVATGVQQAPTRVWCFTILIGLLFQWSQRGKLFTQWTWWCGLLCRVFTERASFNCPFTTFICIFYYWSSAYLMGFTASVYRNFRGVWRPCYIAR